jgi:hypothetical protein
MSAESIIYTEPMDKKLFEELIAHTRLQNKDLVAAAKAVMVDGMKARDAIMAASSKKTAVDSAHLSRTIDNIEQRLEAVLPQHGMVYMCIVVPAHLEPGLRAMHDGCVEEIKKARLKRQQRRSKR